MTKEQMFGMIYTLRKNREFLHVAQKNIRRNLLKGETMISPFKERFRVTCERGDRILFGKKEYHKGLDLVGKKDTTVYAVAAGNVYAIYEKNGFGKYIRQVLPDGRRIYYAHLDEYYVKSGTFVTAGTPLGKMGATGKVTGAHLHLELRPKGFSADSLDICEFCGIPNERGEYEADTQSKISYDDLVDDLIKCGIVTEENMVSWELMLSERAPIRTDYVRTLLERCCKKIIELERKKE